MRELGILLISFLGAFLLISSKPDNPVDRQLEDARALKSVILEKEGRLDLHTVQDSIIYHLNDLEAQLNDERTLLEQFKLYSSTLSMIQCGHTQIHPTRETLREWLAERKSLPIDYYLIGKRLVVNKLLSKDDYLIHEGKSKYEQKKKIPAGAEILSLNGKTVPEMMEDIGRYLSSDENSVDFKYFQASQLFEFYRHLADPFDQDSVQVVYTYNADTTSTYLQTGAAPVHTMNSRIFKWASEFQEGEKDHGQFRVLNGKYGYFRFRSFQTSFGKGYEHFIKESFEVLNARSIDKLIIDLRGNTGGAMQYSIMRYFVGEGIPLGRYVVEKPKKGFESKYFKKFSFDYLRHRHLSNEQKRQQNRHKFNDGNVVTEKVDTNLIYKGQIIVITDEGTFSSAAMFACHLKTLANAKILGSAPGGSFYAGNAGSLQARLPNSGFKVYVNPNTFYSHLPLPIDPLKIKQPDIVLDQLIINPVQRDSYYKKNAMKSF